MAPHEYNAREALDLLMHKLNEHDEQLARQIQSAIDAGKDVEEESVLAGVPSRAFTEGPFDFPMKKLSM